MPDETYDAVIAGGGNRGLFLAMYLAKYGGMSVGIFESRHEIGGGMAGEEAAAPGHLGNTHATLMLPWYYLPAYRDFPEFEGYGVKLEQHLCAHGAAFADNKTCLLIYSFKHDPTQERTARELARFSERDAETWLKVWGIRDAFEEMSVLTVFNPPGLHGSPEIVNRQMAIVPKLQSIGMAPEPITLQYSAIRSAREFWESKEMQYLATRFVTSTKADPTEPKGGISGGPTLAPTLPNWCFAVGGTHNVAHACHKILLANGVKVWTHSEVEKFIIEDGTAKGIRLTDGTEIGARKVVVSAGLSPFQLVDMIGRERLSSKLLRRVDLLEDRFALLGWYTWALREPPKYEAAQFNPDVNDAFWFALAQSADPEHVARECYWRRLAKMPPLEDYNPMIWCHSLVDPSYAPEGRHTANHEQLVIPLSALTEKGWMEFKKQHAEDIVTIWQWHAPNMTWDNIIGYDANTPYDHCRLKNCARNGCWSVIDGPPYQQGQFRPTPELANHRTPITNLYATGTAWHVGGEAGAQGGYNCYKIIAEDLGLGKPWLEPGKEEPESLIQEWRIRERKLLESAKVKA